ncbi:MAG: hypothetical protein ACRD1X_22540 [Vicinamibacteria bacterium]
MKDPELESYCREIEAFFFRWKGRPGSLSPEDFARVKHWFSEGVSLQAVLQGIDNAFESQRSGREGEEVNSLAYCESFVKRASRQRKLEHG